jgi:hypothetical protein
MHLTARLAVSLAALVCVGAGLAAGCSGFSAQDGPPDASGDSPVASDATVGDAPADATTTEANVAFVCPAGALLCDDFERNTLLGSWGGFVGDNDAAAEASTLTIDTEFSTSPTRSLKTVPRGITQAALTKELTGFNRVEVSFSLRTEAMSTTQVHILGVELDPGIGFVQLLLKDGQLMLLEQLRPLDGGEYYSPENAGMAPVGAFERYTFVVDRSAKTFSLAHGGMVSPRVLTQAHGPMTRLYIGDFFTSGNSTPHWIDDVVVVASP